MAETQKWDPLAYLDEMNYNNHEFPVNSHIMDFVPEKGEKKIRVCRCWQSKKFPICDDTHKQLVEIGDNAGPFIVTMGKPAPGLKSVATRELTVAARQGNKFAGAGIALAVVAGYGAAELILQGKKIFGSKTTEEHA